MRNLPIRWKITILSYAVVIVSLMIGGGIIVANIQQKEEKELRIRSMNTARTVAEMSDVKKSLQETNGWVTLNSVIENIRVINETDYIVVMNMERVRYSHPVKEMIGKRSKGADEKAAFAEHIYFSKAKGEIGTVIRAFMPIKDQNLNQIGVVVVGNKIPNFFEIMSELRGEILFIVILTLILGLIGSLMLANHIKKQMFQLEPYEIKRILEERTATFHSMNEGVIAIDNQEMITVFNEKAKQVFHVTGDVVGQPIRKILQDTRLPEIVEKNQAVYNEEIKVSGKVILSNRIPIKKDNELIGAVAIFQDRTEVTKLAEELTGVKNFVEALRVQSHEHMNKLHTIAGLIQLGKADKALQLAYNTSEEQESVTNYLNETIKNDAVAGLLLSKVSRGKELGIQVSIDQNSYLEAFPYQVDQHDFVVLLGNLIENAFGSFERIEVTNKRIDISIEQSEDVCAILIEDNGCGIKEEYLPRLYEKGFTVNKRDGTGYGLFLVKQIVEKGRGEIRISSFKGEGTSFIITFPMEMEAELYGV
ncbi:MULTISPECIES: sensor histidine kinase [unclassified Bacillus (in: firmicutes)]|uniref:ATP-binding protein n=1 Tax=unclassified Bacillus (in: firmicutes) TaxID=185979 RepID=UPI0008DF0252|nr:MULTISPECIES: sensor histidine kinase [unclassified Bacillus (in: firmicutes)]SFJ47063.1 two-component system, CitB family, sensor histidine kinase DctS [Bacillus sp. 71mf]SFT18528.1 two-component system, CitB family, sensor histidine kinase DctS [Bacillus sp. 103mf]